MTKEKATEDTIDQWIKENNEKLSAMVKTDKKAKKNKTLIGRYINEPVADGYGYYVVTKVTRQRCVLEHLQIGDAWTISFVEMLDGIVPKKYVKKNIQAREAMENLFKKAKKG